MSLPASPHLLSWVVSCQQAEGSSSPWGSSSACCWGLRLVPAVAGSEQRSHGAGRLPRYHPGLSHGHTYPSGREGIGEKWDGWGTSGSHCSRNCSSSQGLVNPFLKPPGLVSPPQGSFSVSSILQCSEDYSIFFWCLTWIVLTAIKTSCFLFGQLWTKKAFDSLWLCRRMLGYTKVLIHGGHVGPLPGLRPFSLFSFRRVSVGPGLSWGAVPQTGFIFPTKALSVLGRMEGLLCTPCRPSFMHACLSLSKLWHSWFTLSVIYCNC